VALGLIAGVALDGLIGDPRRGHPVAGFGRAATALERRIYRDSRARGTAYTAACVLSAALPAAVLARLTRRSAVATAAATALATWAVTGARSLTQEAERTRLALTDDDLPAARRQLRALCARDPESLDAAGIARAVVESVAENTSDAVVAPLFWGAVAGLPGLVAYRAVNTLDAMVGYRSPRYERFGWAAARLDDAANWVPARIAAVLTIACAPVATAPVPTVIMGRSGRDTPSLTHDQDGPVPVEGPAPAAPPSRAGLAASAAAFRALRAYGARHPSPNAGRCESAFAGALGVSLGGTNVYHGVEETRPSLGDGAAPGPADIRRAVRLSRAITLAATAAAALLALAWRSSRRTAGR
jgi:adenosylcobinamide-phosphate synthase